MSEDDFFTVVKVKELQPGDFYLGSRTPTMLKKTDTTLVLFYLPGDTESEELRDIWAALGEEVASMDFVAVNGKRQTEIMKAFTETGGNPNNPLYPFRVTGFPTIMVYREGWPQAFYNGERTYDDLLAYSLRLAWQDGYYEPVNIYEGVAKSRPELRTYERRTAGDTYVSDYIERLSEREPAVTPYAEPGVLLTEDQAAAEMAAKGETPIESEDVT